MEITFTQIKTFCFHHYGCVNVVWCGENLLNDDFLRIIPELLDDHLFIFSELVSQMLAQKGSKVLLSIIDILDVYVGPLVDGLFPISILDMVIILQNNC